MAYLRYYQYRGDPGLFSSAFKAIGGLVKKVAPTVVGMIPGVGAIGRGVVGKVLGGGAGKAASSVAAKAGASAASGAAFGLGGAAVGAALGGLGGMFGGKGKGEGGHRRRRMNPGNIRALRRSMSRVQSFAKLAKSTISFTTHTRMKKRGRKR